MPIALEKKVWAMSIGQKRLLAALLVAGGVGGGSHVLKLVKKVRSEQKSIFSELQQGSSKLSGRSNSQRIGVDKKFLNRLLVILSICVPSPVSREALLIGIQGVLLVSRTLLTDYISRIEGHCGRAIVQQQFEQFGRGVLGFAVVGIPAALVNAGLKYMQKQIMLCFQERLTTHLHEQYCSNRAYYAASILKGLTNADQRMTEDVEKFSFAISELYSYTFKPLLDVVLFTRSLSRTMGYRGQLGLYAYYVAVAYLLRAISPPLAQMTAQEAALTGSFRAAHQRLVANAEEVAFNDPPAGVAEEMVLNQHLRRLIRYTGLSSFQRFLQQIADGYFIKYMASAVALVVYALPLYMMDPSQRGSQGKLTSDYIRSMRLLQNSSRGVGDLILVYKRVTNLASHTSRVAELLEQVKQLRSHDGEHSQMFRKTLSAVNLAGTAGGDEGHLAQQQSLPPPQRVLGDVIRFESVAMDSPDGQPLVRDLCLEVAHGQSVIVMGPNGCGKSSLFRVLAGLWPLQAGTIVCPPRERLFYLSQRPYLVTGTLRDQIIYPHPPRAVLAAATPEERERFAAASSGRQALPEDLDQQLEAILAKVELGYLLSRGSGWDQVQNWSETLSGGEKQRLAMARLLWHKPDFAILDECTSAISADGELKLYRECMASGITLLSIAHRPALKHFHKLVLHIDGTIGDTGKGWWVEEVGDQELHHLEGHL